MGIYRVYLCAVVLPEQIYAGCGDPVCGGFGGLCFRGTAPVCFCTLYRSCPGVFEI